ncbi:MAG: V-type ATP synthase subunit F [Candidatus Heimdallarchaeota archaeon]
MKIVAIGDEDTIIGLQLAGVKETIILDESDPVENIIVKLSRQEGVAVILITERLAAQALDIIAQIQQERTYPVIIEIPDKGGKIKKETDTLKELVKQAVGVELEI